MKRFKNKISVTFLLLVIGLQYSCTDEFLEMTPKSIISENQLVTTDNAEGLVISAYSELGNDHYTAPNSLWPYADITSGDAYKGGGGTGDISEFNAMELFDFNTTNNGLIDQKWYRLYVGIGRVNTALKVIDQLSVETYPKKTQRQAELRFIRAHHYFVLKTLFKFIPWIDETIPSDQYNKVSNVALKDQELWDKIAAEFKFSSENLPASQTEKGRPNKFAAKAYLAKVKLYSAYQQNEENAVINIDNVKLREVVSLVDEVIGSGQYVLFADYGYNFLQPYDEAGKESVFSIQRSVDDGTSKGRLDWGNALNYPMNPEYGCCWFHIPSQNLVNSFKTDVNGVPQFSAYNNSDVKETADFNSSTSFDVRLDHTVAIPGHPWKYDPNFIYQKNWARATDIYGHFSSLKENQHYKCACFEKVPPFMASSKNTDIIRYADVLLWKAEALIKLGRETEALTIINDIRQRAINSKGMLKDNSGNAVSNYRMDIYKPGVNCTWNNEFAFKALQWERRLEFAMEGIRFFDLVRWGIAADYMNSYFESESSKREYIKSGRFTKGKHEYFPIPQNQINFSGGLYKQNKGW
jgi:tetratricopeptide (TPR) repeat protein